MDKSIQYAHVMSNFDSVYNVPPSSTLHYSPVYVPTSSFSSHPSQSISPSLSLPNPKFNFDLYQPTESLPQFCDYPSPSSSVIVHHHPVYSPPPSQAISKLRQINDELCYTLAQSELPVYSPPVVSSYHVHHRSVSPRIYHSSYERDSSTESERSEPKSRKARITSKVHIPQRRLRQQRPQQQSVSDFEQLLASTSDAYAQDDPLTVDLYPTRDQGYVRRVRNRPDNQRPWLPDNLSARRNSYSGQSTYRTPRGPDYDSKPIQPNSRLSDCKVRPRSSSVKSRLRRDSPPNGLRYSTSSFSATAPVWRPNGTIRHQKFIGSNAPPSAPKPARHEPTWKPSGIATKTKSFRAFDPAAKAAPRTQEPVWHPPSKDLKKKPLKYFEPTLKPEWTGPIQPQTELVVPRKPAKTVNRVHSGNTALKTRVANAESKVKSAWESSTTTVKPRPPIPRPVTTTLPAKTKVKAPPAQRPKSVKKVVPVPATTADTGRSSLNDVPTQPLFQSTPRNQSFVDVDDDDAINDMFGDEGQVSVVAKKPVIPPPSRPIEKTPPRKPITTVPQPSAKNSSTIKDDVLIHGDDGDDRTPSPPLETNHNGKQGEIQSQNVRSAQPSPILPEPKESSPKPGDIDEVVDEAIDFPSANDTNADAGENFESEGIDDDVQRKQDTNPSIPPKRAEPSFDGSSGVPETPRPSTPPAAAATTTNNHDVNDFFD